MRSPREIGVAVLAAAVLGLASCGGPAALTAPRNPYDHQPVQESSAASTDVGTGQVETVVSGLRSIGFWCASVRSNAAARQVWCRSGVDVGTPEPAVTVLDMVAGTDGAVQYASVSLPDLVAARQSDPSQSDRLLEVLGVSTDRVWASDADAVHAAVAQVASGRKDKKDDPAAPLTRTVATGSATYTVKEQSGTGASGPFDGHPLLSFDLVTAAAAGADWPYGSSDYASTRPIRSGTYPSGLRCTGKVVASCSFGAARVDFERFPGGGQVVAAQLFVPAATPASSPVLDDMLAFLVPRTRKEVADQVASAMRLGKPLAAIAGSTVVVITPAAHEAGARASVAVSVGVAPVMP